MSMLKKKSELNAGNRYEYEKLIRKFECLVPCKYEEREEEILFEYNCDALINVSQLRKEDRYIQLQFLINFIRLYDVYLEYDFSCQVANVYYDENYIPCIMERDIYGAGKKPDEAEFLFTYKTYVGALLGEKYSVTQLQESGLEILEQEQGLKSYLEAQTKEELVTSLRKERAQYYAHQKKEMIQISKKKNRIKNVLLVILPILFGSAFSLLVYYMAILTPYQQAVILANEAFVQKKYVECIDSLETVDIEEMNINSKYILAFSYAKSENLEKEKIETLTSKLSTNSNVKELEYWICLGRLDMEQAEGLAKALSDDKLLIYAYMKELNQLEKDTLMNGEEKQSRISELEEAITNLGEKYAPIEDNETEEMLIEETPVEETSTGE